MSLGHIHGKYWTEIYMYLTSRMHIYINIRVWLIIINNVTDIDSLFY